MDGNRRRALAMLAAGLAPASVRAQAQKVRRIGYLAGFVPRNPKSPVWLVDRLKPLGFVEGSNLVIERSFGTDDPAELTARAKALCDRGVELIVTAANGSAAGALSATRTVPIVVTYGIVPVEAGFVRSLSHPGTNVTGNAAHTPETTLKAFDLLREALPKAKTATQVWNPNRAGYAEYEKALSQAGRDRGIAVDYVAITRSDQWPEVVRRLSARPTNLLLVAFDISFDEAIPHLAKFARERKLPSVGSVEYWPESGGLMSFGPDDQEILDRAARYVARILRGARPSDLPLEQPSKYRLTINATCARAIGYPVPQSLLIRADRIIDS